MIQAATGWYCPPEGLHQYFCAPESAAGSDRDGASRDGVGERAKIRTWHTYKGSVYIFLRIFVPGCTILGVCRFPVAWIPWIVHIFSLRSRLQPRFLYSIARHCVYIKFQPTRVCAGESGRSSWPCHQLHGVPGEWLVLGEAAGSRRLLLVCNRLFLHSCSSI